MSDTIDGTKITSVNTMSSMYDNGDIVEFVGDDGTVYRVSLREFIMPLLNGMEFNVVEKRGRNYLKPILATKKPCSLCGSVMEH